MRSTGVTACPQCQLPTEDDAFQCDGCGLLFRKDFSVVRSELQTKLRSARLALGVTVLVDLGLIGVVIYMAMNGWYYVSIPLALGIVGTIVHGFQRISVLRGHLALLDRRHVELPAATVHAS